jgi:hypothetical protein
MTAGAGSEPRVLRFRGRTSCRRDGEGPLGLLLVGRITQDREEEDVEVAFSCPAPSDLPAELEDAKLELVAGNRHRLTSGERSWSLQGPVHVHREISPVFYKALPPRPVPIRKRLFWRVMLTLAANPVARRLLLRGR